MRGALRIEAGNAGNFRFHNAFSHPSSMIMRIRSAGVAFLLTLPSLAGLAGDACACTIPVFRYALDRWEADRFQLLLPEEVAKEKAVSDLLRPLRANGIANLSITTATEPGPQQAELRTARLGGQTLWSGALDQAALSALLDSPARQQLLKQILAGDSIIWVLAIDDSEAGQAEAERVEKRLRFLEQVAALPIQDPNDPDSQLGPGPPLLLKFTTLRLRRDDPAERLLLKMLAGPSATFDPGATSFAAAVFGRGRVLGSWALNELDDQALEEASMFLIGRCSCRVKDQNPGWDILMNVDWDRALRNAASAAPEIASPPTAKELTQPVSVKATPVSSAPQNSSELVFDKEYGVGFKLTHSTSLGGSVSSATYLSWQTIAVFTLLLSLCIAGLCWYFNRS